MKPQFELQQVEQCTNCPWREGADLTKIPGYVRENHKKLSGTIAKDTNILNQQLRIMACHNSTKVAVYFCIGWLHNQLGIGNNILLRLEMRNCSNIKEIKLKGEQKKTFESTLGNF